MLSTVEKVLFLKSIDLFSQIPGDNLAEVALIATEENRDAGEEILVEGELGDALYLILEGRIRLHHGDKAITELGERECLAEMALLDPRPELGSATAATAAQLLRISRQDFQELLVQSPEIALAIIKVLSRRLRDATR